MRKNRCSLASHVYGKPPSLQFDRRTCSLFVGGSSMVQEGASLARCSWTRRPVGEWHRGLASVSWHQVLRPVPTGSQDRGRQGLGQTIHG